MNKQIHRPDVALMRHARYRGEERRNEEVTLVSTSVDICRRNIIRLIDQVGSEVIIIHSSPNKRALLTRDVVGSELGARGIEVVQPEPCKWLTCGKKQITKEAIDASINGNGGFSIFIGHMPDIEYFMNNYDEIPNGAILAKDFSIK